MIVVPGSTSISADVFFADDTGAAVTGKVAADFPVAKSRTPVSVLKVLRDAANPFRELLNGLCFLGMIALPTAGHDVLRGVASGIIHSVKAVADKLTIAADLPHARGRDSAVVAGPSDQIKEQFVRQRPQVSAPFGAEPLVVQQDCVTRSEPRRSSRLREDLVSFPGFLVETTATPDVSGLKVASRDRLFFAAITAAKPTSFPTSGVFRTRDDGKPAITQANALDTVPPALRSPREVFKFGTIDLSHNVPFREKVPLWSGPHTDSQSACGLLHSIREREGVQCW